MLAKRPSGLDGEVSALAHYALRMPGALVVATLAALSVPRMAWVPKKGPTTLLFEASRRVLRVGDEVASWFG